MKTVFRSLIITLALAKGYTAQQPDVNQRDRRGATPLMQAAAFGTAETVKTLIDAGADVNARNSFDATALVWAAADFAKVSMLVEKGADVNSRTKLGRTPLMVASSCDGCSEIVRYLLTKGANAKAADGRGKTVLQIAAESGDGASVRLLLAAGADASAQDQGGGTALMGAMMNCDFPSAQALIAKGADVNAALTFAGAVKAGPIALVQLTPLILASAYCGPREIKLLLDAGANAGAKDIRGMTPLIIGVSSEIQNPEVTRLLLRAGADINAAGSTGETALDWAKKFGNRAVISEMRAGGVDEGAPYTAPARPPFKPRTIVEAVDDATALTERSGTEFFRQSGCVGCHHQPLALLAASAGRAAGAKVDDAALRGFAQTIESEWTGEQEQLLERIDPGGGADGEEYMAWAMASANYAPNAITNTIAVHVAAMQHAAGNWHEGDISRSPIQESEIARTARALRLLQVYGPPAKRVEFAERIGRARDWLGHVKPVTNDDGAMQMVGLHWASRDVTALGRALMSRQRPDGGWGQNPNLESDAFATGESLWALRESGILNARDAAYQRGVKYLMSTQWPDGSWYVRSRAPKIQPYFQSAFPFEHDQWISAAATSWAVMALAPAIERDK